MGLKLCFLVPNVEVRTVFWWGQNSFPSRDFATKRGEGFPVLWIAVIFESIVLEVTLRPLDTVTPNPINTIVLVQINKEISYNISANFCNIDLKNHYFLFISVSSTQTDTIHS